MKEFRKAIQSYLDQRAKQDPQFAENYAKDGKSIVDCCNYIMRQAQKRGGQAVVMSDDEVYGLAIHYYDEDIPANECRPIRGAAASAPAKPTQAPKKAEAKPKPKKEQPANGPVQLSIW